MKIAIPVDEKYADSNGCVPFGRTPYFLLEAKRTPVSLSASAG
ncbi:MAG: hypothetical protein PHI98_14305 [Eubacteriales bacterium]|nr:hypothetical protein [Eubacteriales bacterium]